MVIRLELSKFECQRHNSFVFRTMAILKGQHTSQDGNVLHICLPDGEGKTCYILDIWSINKVKCMGAKVCLIQAPPFQVVYHFVFVEGDISSPFGIYTCHPRSVLDPSIVSADLEGTLVEEGESPRTYKR